MPRLAPLALPVLALLLAAPAAAHHPGHAELDAAIAAREPGFRPVGAPAPGFAGPEAMAALAALGDRVVVLSFAEEPCAGPCAAQAALVAELQAKTNVSLMRDLVAFVTIAPAGAADPGLDPANAVALYLPGPEVAALRAAFDALSPPPEGAGGVAVHVLDRGGRLAGTFHGAGASTLAMVLYVNGLTNAPVP